MIDRPIHVIGGGLAGTEAAWQIAQAGIPVILHEMRPIRSSPAHHSQFLAELVCSNSFGAMAVDRATGLLHEELRRLNSLVIAQADQHSVPAGGALAVDRGVFSRNLTEMLANHPLITLKRQEITEIPRDGIVVLTTGPLTSAALAADLQNFTGLDYLSFFDAASPIILGESIDRSIAFLASRYDKGEAAYLNCPMDREQYLHFWQELKQAEQAELKDFERENAKFFEACLPIEELACRGEDTMRFGPLKPVGLADPRYPDQRPYAVIQLRMEDKAGQLWNMVGFQTNLKWGEQTRVFRLIPGLEKAEFVRMGVMHKNTFINSPQLLSSSLQFKSRPTLLAAGQLIGTEGYTAAAAGGWLAGTNAARLVLGLETVTLPTTTMMGSLFEFISSAEPKHFQPMPPNFGILPNFSQKIRNKRERYGQYADRSLQDLEAWWNQLKTPCLV
ncbi:MULTISPECIES: FADH(2)-oxidizing methylenetetrahydrofolate--tRNA-(uracil(54)-C(5))-methyltransferase TrmFO [unclassified Microcystis]|jgi:methylenetetrahydrofolate--tRNA-(uracil-5-)-methyltransferase|uniref:FADH(2)-oxidizing methylenetetrahydrofolate--tRNA-(uracil(54)-C(5))- methyltransferase TrmFO n=1 Tax=unclassified Microcystis TaxID=2643300 RepID=UPI00258E6D75|nr:MULTISPECIES: FADH(2)-oxidizing methylenetetrahydrofolate--tRNA-(uracil(54)-C(5))-methyltransferase TrmFO [unclassified Microcystis]MCA2764494.1 FADH(2)-oxidizing methylenetetrahydrofolate--tRNA-(uracil(54)-C(5))-methyltransferase TrmFO [Microcystis sp. M151S2]MCA2642859.1 FADH(2)-oxidizing methylenetetrahydrofolate--tRNA-(uracil(54)-C(5))-methyltransferase TrmFO [Microcystis sp. M087S2]MCA2670467.1 FADH(2)-oxidizing methylenetetrahydrofolate--tRNA-(uracil(54)-C(5))-methyltransferase TrmFO [M